MRALLLCWSCSPAAPRCSIRCCARRATTSRPGAASRRSRSSSARARENPDRIDYRAEYFRVRDLLAAQWLAQAETLRSSGQPEAAADALPPRAEVRRRQRARARRAAAARGRRAPPRARRRRREADQGRAVPRGAGRAAPGAGREPAAPRRAPPAAPDRRAHRQAGDRHAAPEDRAAQPISLELRDVTLRAVFDTISRTTGVSFVLDRDVRADQRTTHRAAQRHARGADPPGARHQPARAEGGQRDHGAGLPQHAAEAARVPGAGGEELLPRQRRRAPDRQHGARAGEDARPVHRREAQPAGDQGHARPRCASPSA